MILGLGEKLKNSDFILESKMAEVTQNKNSIQLDQPNILCENFILPWKSREHSTQLFTRVLLNRCSKSIRKFPKGVKLGSFLQSSAHIFKDMVPAYEILI